MLINVFTIYEQETLIFSAKLSMKMFYNLRARLLYFVEESLDLLDSSVYDVMLRTMRNNISEPDIQVVCCGTVSYLAGSGKSFIV